MKTEAAERMRQRLEKRLLPKLKVRLIMRRAVFCAAALLCSGQVFLRFFGLVVVLFGCFVCLFVADWFRRSCGLRGGGAGVLP
jgi:hypothetical protein